MKNSEVEHILDKALAQYEPGIDRAVRFLTIDQVDMVAEHYLHHRAALAEVEHILDKALAQYEPGIDRAVRFLTIDQVDMVAEHYLHHRAALAEVERLRAALVAIRKLNTAEPGGPDQVWVHSGLIAQEIFAALKEPKP
jgi:hypothetical protein